MSANGATGQGAPVQKRSKVQAGESVAACEVIAARRDNKSLSHAVTQASGCGETGIRTQGTREGHNGFRDRPVQPLRHLSRICTFHSTPQSRRSFDAVETKPDGISPVYVRSTPLRSRGVVSTKAERRRKKLSATTQFRISDAIALFINGFVRCFLSKFR